MISPFNYYAWDTILKMKINIRVHDEHHTDSITAVLYRIPQTRSTINSTSYLDRCSFQVQLNVQPKAKVISLMARPQNNTAKKLILSISILPIYLPKSKPSLLSPTRSSKPSQWLPTVFPGPTIFSTSSACTICIPYAMSVTISEHLYTWNNVLRKRQLILHLESRC